MLLQLNHIKKTYSASTSFRKAARPVLYDIQLSLNQGDSIALVGESGCGKSTLGKIAAGLEQADSGDVIWNQTSMNKISNRKLKELRRNVQMVYQNSSATFHPLQSIGLSMREPLLNYHICAKKEAKEQVLHCMEQVGLQPQLYDRLPAELSGGQRQRANIARGLILHPQLLVCDEVVSSLDFSLRRQVLDLLNELKQNYQLSYLFISHDLSTVKYVCNQVIIMYRGAFVERLDTLELLEERVCHPYAKELFHAIPVKNPLLRRQRSIALPNGWDIQPEKGCAFQNRCPDCKERCRQEQPNERQIAPGHLIACHKETFL